MSNRGKLLSQGLAAIRGWEVWSLAEPLRSAVIAVPVLAVAATCVAATGATFHLGNFVVFCTLIACGMIAIEVTGSAVREPQGTIIRDLLMVWYLAIAITLPPIYAMLAPLPLGVFRLWRVHHTHLYRRVYSNATLSLSYGCAALMFRAFPASAAGAHPGTGAHLLVWVGIVGACGLVASIVDYGLLLVAVKLADPAASARSLITSRETMVADLVELSLGVSVALLVALNPVLVALVLPSLAMYRRYLLHAQLVSQSRTDGKTGLLNAATWEREAAAEVSRAVRTRTPLAIVLLDLDKFKLINDTYGHLAGDEVLKATAKSLQAALRDYDQAGRFGGEEFVVLLPSTRSADALRVAERIRAVVERMVIEDPAGGGHIPVTVSAGVAALDGGSNRELTELLSIADAALYRAKSSGRNQVQMISTTRGLSAARTSPQLEAVAPEASTASISELPVRHSEASPVLRTLGVAYPWQVHPSTLIGAPPPVPWTSPFLKSVA
jgi:diguanylate cyclase (GGDEF)-like protein